jgi:hypothetical protein
MVKMVNVCLLFFLSDSKLNLIVLATFLLSSAQILTTNFVLHNLIEYLVKFQHLGISKFSAMLKMVTCCLLIFFPGQ